MPTFEDHPGVQCARCGYAFRKNDRFQHVTVGADEKGVNGAYRGVACENEKGCRRRQRTPKPEYANPDATADEMLEKIAATLTRDVRDLMLAVSENEDWMRYSYRACFDSRPLVKIWR